MLSPDRSWHKRKFELEINDLCFLGRPVFSRDDGTWRKRKNRVTRPHDAEKNTSQSDADIESKVAISDPQMDVETNEQIEVSEPTEKSELVMFNVVFVLEPPILEYGLRVEEMYENVVKKFSRALRWAQGHTDYVLKESELIKSLSSKYLTKRASPETWYQKTLIESSLASTISSVFTNIALSRIASVSLGPSVAISLQIPPAASTSVLPSLMDLPGQLGLWLTTATDAPATLDIDTTSPSLSMSKHFTLLLKTNKARIIRDIQAAGGPFVNPMVKFINALNPTKSFYKISLSSGIKLSDIQELSRHLVEWRRAIAVPPLNQRDTYIVSPNADMTSLKSASKAYEAAFPNLPPLPQMLAKLSEIPKPWYYFIPSSDHKEAYYEVLAFLLRGGWVTQLRTRAFVRIGPHIKKLAVGTDGGKTASASQSTKKSEQEQNASQSRPALLSQHSSDASTTTIPLSSISTNPAAIPTPTPSSLSASIPTPSQSQSTTNLSLPHRPHTIPLRTQPPQIPDIHSASLITNPNRANPQQATYLSALQSSLLSSPEYSHLLPVHRQECYRFFPIIQRYCNGEEALERIAIREGLKRKDIWQVLGWMGCDFDGGVERWGRSREEDANGEQSNGGEGRTIGDAGDGLSDEVGEDGDEIDEDSNDPDEHRSQSGKQEEAGGNGIRAGRRRVGAGDRQGWLVTVRHW